MKKINPVLLLTFLFVQGVSFAQEKEAKKEDKPVLYPFESGLLIDEQTGQIPDARTFEVVIQHRFGTVKNGFSDLFGIYAPGANIRLGFNYVPLKNLQVGYGLTKINMTSDFQAKWNIIQQTRSGRIPLTVTLFEDIGLDGRGKDDLGINYSFINRLSYYTEVIIGRKFTNWLSLQLQGSFTHYNIVDENYDHERIGVGGSGRIKFSPQSSFIFQYNAPLNLSSMTKNTPEGNLSKANFGLGYEVSTYTHVFQIYFLNSTEILPQANYLYNLNDFTKGDFLIGFTITRLWSF